MTRAKSPGQVESGRPSLKVVLARFASVGVLTVSVDLGLLAVLHSALGVQLLVATTIAYGLSLIVNYSLNHSWAFSAEGNHAQRVRRYLVLVAINYGLTIGMVAGLTNAGLYYLLAKVVAVLVGAAINFFGYRRWVFA
jgi:putative flippase GtrA